MHANQPEMQAFAIIKRRGQKDLWQPIGNAFAQSEGNGYEVLLRELPVPDGDGLYKIVLRPPKRD